MNYTGGTWTATRFAVRTVFNKRFCQLTPPEYAFPNRRQFKLFNDTLNVLGAYISKCETYLALGFTGMMETKGVSAEEGEDVFRYIAVYLGCKGHRFTFEHINRRFWRIKMAQVSKASQENME